MIQLPENEKQFLEKKFADVPDRDLIRELLRRGRFREYNCSAEYWKEMRSDDRYMDMIRDKLLYRVAKAIDSDKAALPALITECPDVTDAQYRKTIMTAGIITLNARSRKEG